MVQRQPDWSDGTHAVMIDRRSDGTIYHLGIRRCDGSKVRDWRTLQRLKNTIAGAEIEAAELYPAQRRVIDMANIYHLWCAPPGEQLDLGMDLNRSLERMGETMAAAAARFTELSGSLRPSREESSC